MIRWVLIRVGIPSLPFCAQAISGYFDADNNVRTIFDPLSLLFFALIMCLNVVDRAVSINRKVRNPAWLRLFDIGGGLAAVIIAMFYATAIAKAKPIMENGIEVCKQLPYLDSQAWSILGIITGFFALVAFGLQFFTRHFDRDPIEIPGVG